MDRIFKYDVSQHDFELDIPYPYKFLSVQSQKQGMVTRCVMWCQVPAGLKAVKQYFKWYVTGEKVEPQHVYLATLQMEDGTVWHLYRHAKLRL